MINGVEIAENEHENSKLATKTLTNAIIAQQVELPPSQQSGQLEALYTRMTPEQLRATTIAQEAGTSNWLSTLPLAEKDMCLQSECSGTISVCVTDRHYHVYQYYLTISPQYFTGVFL